MFHLYIRFRDCWETYDPISAMVQFPNTQVLILDIEGTICSILFVKDVLYPYFKEKYPQIVERLLYPLVPTQDITNEAGIINNMLCDMPKHNSYDELVDYINDLVVRDIKDPVLKSFQGFVWKLGYENGELLAPLYNDAIEFIKVTSQTKKVYIYSSGSVKAQKLLFSYVKDPQTSKAIDMNGYLSGYFDITTSGVKQSPESYRNILEAIGSDKGEEVVFLSDNVEEIRAAKEAGLKGVIVQRPGNPEVEQEDIDEFGVVSDFRGVEML